MNIIIIFTILISSTLYSKTTSRFVPSIDSDNPGCTGSSKDKSIRSFSKLIMDTIAPLNNGLIPTDGGYLVDSACLENYGEDFFNILSSTMSQGMECISRLAEQKKYTNSTNTGLPNVIEQLLELKKQKTTSIICSEKDYNWTKTAGHASSSSNDVIKDMEVEHPFISLSPKIKISKSNYNYNEQIISLKETLFHEQFHNLGFMHGQSIEYPYACGKCCFPSELGKAQSLSCKICRGDYQSTESVDYLKDITSLAKLDGRLEFAVFNLIINSFASGNNLKEKMTLFAILRRGYSDHTGTEILKRLKADNLIVDEEIKEILKQQKKYEDSNYLSFSLSGNAYYEYYLKSNHQEALSILKTNLQFIESEIEEATAAGDIYIARNIIFDIEHLSLQLYKKVLKLDLLPKEKTDYFSLFSEVTRIQEKYSTNHTDTQTNTSP